MRLKKYLSTRGETEAEFAKRARLPRSTVNTICYGRAAHVDTAIKIISATGGLVALGDLQTEPEQASA